MVAMELREVIDALSAEDQLSLLEYLERIVSVGDEPLTNEQLATVCRRDAEMDADPTLGISEEEFFSRLESKWL